jgi:3-oxoacyl-(acyl-carrier-protein) synthase
MCEGKSGIVKLPSWADEYPAQLAGVVPDWDPKAAGLKGKTIKRNGRYTHFALAAATEALQDSGLDTSAVDQTRFGCILGSGIGGVEWFENNCNAFTAAGGGYDSLRQVDPFLIPALIANTASGMIAIQHGAKGKYPSRLLFFSHYYTHILIVSVLILALNSHHHFYDRPQLLCNYCVRKWHALYWSCSQTHERR